MSQLNMPTLRPHQKITVDAGLDYIDSDVTAKSLLIEPTACHAAGYRVLMFDGTFKVIENIKVGDLVMGPDSKSREVTLTHAGSDTMYEIILSSHGNYKECITVNSRHILHLHKGVATNNPKEPDILEISVLDYLSLPKYLKAIYKFKKAPLIVYNKVKDLPLDSYQFGKWMWTKFDETNPCIDIFKNYLLSSDVKFIPLDYLTSSVTSRWQLLSGIVDAAAIVTQSRYYYVKTPFKQLADDIFQLANSLALLPFIRRKHTDSGFIYTISWAGNSNIQCITPHKNIKERAYKFDISKYSIKVKEVGEGIYYGFTLKEDPLFVDYHHNIIHNSGKSHIIAGIMDKIDTKAIILHPRQELLVQNVAKYEAYGYEAAVYCASLGRKEFGQATFATPHSLKNVKNLAKEGFGVLLVDEAHYLSKKKSMMDNVIKATGIKKVLGFTATPLELRYIDREAHLSMITRSQKNIFTKILNVTQVKHLIDNNYWSPLVYDVREVDESALRATSRSASGDYSASQLEKFYAQNALTERIQEAIEDNPDRQSICVFVSSIDYGQDLSDSLPNAAMVYSGMKKVDRDKALLDYKHGKIRTIVSVEIVSLGFDHPPMDLGIMARPTKSYIIYAQQGGRLVRIHDGVGNPYFPNPKLNSKIIDFSGNVERFGKLEDARYVQTQKGYWDLYCKDVHMTTAQLAYTVPQYKDRLVTLGHYKGRKTVAELDNSELMYIYKNKKPKDAEDVPCYGEVIAALKDRKVIE